MPSEKEKNLWLVLAELFFLDTEPSEKDFTHAALLLNEAGWSRAQTEKFLLHYIAPVAGANLGYLIYPTIGEWAGFDKNFLSTHIERLMEKRHKYPSWFFLLSDKFYAWMLGKLDVEKLLSKL